MPSPSPPVIAVIADAHFHDLSGDYGGAGVSVAGEKLAMVPLASTAKSTRVFNESGRALRHALDDIATRGIRHVFLLGDYSDDGQATTLKGLRALLDEYRNRYEMQFFATPGNHDIFGPDGRHRSRRFLNGNGGYDLVTSDPERLADDASDTVIRADGMRCAGYPQGLNALPDAGFFRRSGDIHWESPFGPADDCGSRLYEVLSPDGETVCSLMDASYLVEPIDGIWMLMIDANVFVPANSTAGDGMIFADSTDAGWNAVLDHKRFLLDWASDVSERALRLGKTLIAFSHYPAIDPLDDTQADECALLGETSLSRRIPDGRVGTALIGAGIHVHFSGHLHVNDTARQTTGDGFLVNVSVPSLVAFPCAYKIIRCEPGRLSIETVGIGDLPLDCGIMDQYRREAETYGIGARRMLDAESYGRFLSEHLGHLVGRRYLRREWPAGLAQAVGLLSVSDLALLALCQSPVSMTDLPQDLSGLRGSLVSQTQLAASAKAHGVSLATLSDISVMAFLGDWYRARMGSDLGLDAVLPERLAAYRFLSSLYRRCDLDCGSAQAAFGRLLRMFERFTTGLPSRQFTIDLATGQIAAI